MANSYGVFRSDNMKATKDGSIRVVVIMLEKPQLQLKMAIL